MKITKEEIARLPIEQFEGRIVVIENEKSATKAIDRLLECDVIGFDTETKPVFRRGQHNKVALMQLATENECFLFRLNKMGYSQRLDNIICNPDIKKIGLSLRDDFAAIRNREYNRKPANFVDLQPFVDKYGIEDNSLQKIYAILFGKKITKNQRLTNWEAKKLSDAQKAYAALDAWACLKIYNFLCNSTNHNETV